MGTSPSIGSPISGHRHGHYFLLPFPAKLRINYGYTTLIAPRKAAPMAQPWNTIASAPTADGLLELRQRGAKDFLIMIGPQVLMNSLANRSEVVLGQLGCGHLATHPAPRVLVGGLGMGFTLRAVLDALPATARVVVAELNPVVPTWCQGPLALLTNSAVTDPRVTVEITDVARLIRHVATSGGVDRFDAIVL